MSRWIGLATGVFALLAGGVPSRAAERSVEVVHMGGAHLGVSLLDVSKQDLARLKLSEERGALVKSVQSDTPAEKAGLKEGDVILRYQGEVVQSAAHLARLVRETPPGRTVSMEVSRGGALQKLSPTLDEGKGGRIRLGDLDIPTIPPIPPDAFHFEGGPDGMGRALLFRHHGPGARRLGIECQEISGQLARFFRLGADRGLLVTSVEEDGPAAKAGLKAGDVILKVGGKDVQDAEDLRHEVRGAPGGEVAITVQRDGKPLELMVMVGAEPRREGGGEGT
jgi:serine protease Do